MLLCLGIIEDALGKRALYKNYDKEDDPFVLERPEIYRRGAVFATGVLYLARATSLHGDFLAQEGSAIICIGMPPEAYLDCPVRVIALDEATDMEELSNDINRIFFEYNTLEQKLQDSVNKGRSVQHMVEILAPYLNGNELMIINSDFRLIAKSNHSLHLNEISGLGQPDEQGFLPPDIVTFFKNDIIFSKVRNLTEPFFYEARFCKGALQERVFRENTSAGLFCPRTQVLQGYEPGLLKFSRLLSSLSTTVVKYSGILPTDSMADVYIDLKG